MAEIVKVTRTRVEAVGAIKLVEPEFKSEHGRYEPELVSVILFREELIAVWKRGRYAIAEIT